MGGVGWGMLTSYSCYVDGWGGVGWGMLTSCSYYTTSSSKNSTFPLKKTTTFMKCAISCGKKKKIRNFEKEHVAAG